MLEGAHVEEWDSDEGSSGGAATPPRREGEVAMAAIHSILAMREKVIEAEQVL